MRVGVPKEIKRQEGRVGLTPEAVREYVGHGHQVLVETGAGAGIGASDAAYVAAGARIAATAAEVVTPCREAWLLACLLGGKQSGQVGAFIFPSVCRGS